MLTSGIYKGDRACGVIHLENMKYDKEYPILIDGKNYILIFSNQDHLWLVPVKK